MSSRLTCGHQRERLRRARPARPRAGVGCATSTGSTTLGRSPRRSPGRGSPRAARGTRDEHRRSSSTRSAWRDPAPAGEVRARTRDGAAPAAALRAVAGPVDASTRTSSRGRSARSSTSAADRAATSTRSPGAASSRSASTSPRRPSRSPATAAATPSRRASSASCRGPGAGRRPCCSTGTSGSAGAPADAARADRRGCSRRAARPSSSSASAGPGGRVLELRLESAALASEWFRWARRRRAGHPAGRRAERPRRSASGGSSGAGRSLGSSVLHRATRGMVGRRSAGSRSQGRPGRHRSVRWRATE